MLLRSSSTPVLGSLLPSFTESPSNVLHSEACHSHKHLPPTSVPQHQQRRSFSQIGSFGLSPFSCNSSPISPSIADLERQNKGFRRVQSEGNLEDLVFNSCSEDMMFSYIDPPKRLSGRQRCLTLETIPSFSLAKHRGGYLEEDEVESDTEDEEEFEEEEGDGFSVVNSGRGMVLTEDVLGMKDGFCRVGFVGQDEVGGGGGGGEMYLAKGLGVGSFGDGMGGCRGGGGGGGDHSSMGSGGNDGDMHGVEEYYKKMVEQNPADPLFLRNYAQFLYQCKHDLKGAEEYYSRAILADPKDGEVLSQYGKLVWELHHDEERASSYFERAAQASPEDSHVHAAYASFLWDTEEGEDGCNESQCLPSHFHQGAIATTGA